MWGGSFGGVANAKHLAERSREKRGGWANPIFLPLFSRKKKIRCKTRTGGGGGGQQERDAI